MFQAFGNGNQEFVFFSGFFLVLARVHIDDDNVTNKNSPEEQGRCLINGLNMQDDVQANR